MKVRVIALLAALVVSALAVAAYGAHIKYDILQPLELDDDYGIVELPFLLYTDDGLRYTVEFAKEMLNATEPTEPSTEPTTEPTTVPTTLPTTLPTTEPTTVPTTGPVTGPDDPTTEPTVEPTTEPTTKPTTEPTTKPTTKPTEPKTEPTTEPTTPVSNTYPGYDFSEGAVSDAWYDDVLFIGDSRTVGLRDYARSGNAEYFCAVGMNVFNIKSKECADVNFSSQKLENLLKSRTYGKIFINLGINECGYPTASIISAYKDLISLIQKHQPDAKIVLQGIMMVSEKYAGSKDHFQPSHINSINKEIEKLADGSTIFYIDVNEYFTNSKNFLYSDITGDGCHLYASYYKVWAQWISFAVGKFDI